MKKILLRCYKQSDILSSVLYRLPASGWWDHYYTPLSNRMDLLRKKYANNDEAGIILMQLKNEMEIHRKYSDEYGYTFFILQSKR